VEEVGVIAAPDLYTAYLKAQEDKTGKRKGVDIAAVEAVQQEIVTFCERKKTLFAVLDSPPDMDPDQVRDWRMRFETKYAACYYPWIKILDPLAGGRGGRNAPTRLVPPSGHVAGLYARTDRTQGVHKAPANEVLNDVVGLARVTPKDLTDVLAPEGINCIRALPGRGIRVWGARTLSSQTLWQHLSVRRLFIMIERSIAEGTDWAVFENNEWGLWKAVEREISRFLFKLWKEGMLRGNTPEEAFYVVCDERNNPPETRDAGEFFCDVGIAAVRPAEFIVFRIGQRTQDIITEEPVS
jgi:phage tail sheath protein FI